jgi:hypothetical protein
MKSKSIRSEFILIIIISFIEGTSLMGSEVLAAKLIAPFFGTSVYVWTAMLIVTLGGIAVGYWLGGSLVAQNKIVLFCCSAVILSSLLLFIMPSWSNIIMGMMVRNLNIISGSLLSLILFLLPVIILFGAVSPLLVQRYASIRGDDTANNSAVIWGTSTFGGIAGVLFVGLYSIPEYGIKTSCLLFAALFFVAGLCYLCFNLFRSKQ